MATQQNRNDRNTLMAHLAHLLLPTMLVLGISNTVIADAPAASDAPLKYYEAQQLTWSQLDFNASILGISFTANLKLNILTDKDAQAKLIKPEQGQGIKPSPHVLSIDLSSSFISSQDIHTQLLFNSDNAVALQRIRHESTEGDERHKVYRFTDKGVFIMRRKPRQGEAKLAAEHWTDTNKRFDRYPAKQPKDRVFSDTSALLYIGSMAMFKNPGDKIEFIAYFNDSLHVVTVEYEATETIKSNFKARRHGQATQRITGDRESLRLAIQAHPLGQPKGDSTLQLAGLVGPVKLLIDKTLRVPVELRGDLGFMSDVALKLDKVMLRNTIH